MDFSEHCSDWLHNMLDFRIACEKYLEVHGDAVKRIVYENIEKPSNHKKMVKYR